MTYFSLCATERSINFQARIITFYLPLLHIQREIWKSRFISYSISPFSLPLILYTSLRTSFRILALNRINLTLPTPRLLPLSQQLLSSSLLCLFFYSLPLIPFSFLLLSLCGLIKLLLLLASNILFPFPLFFNPIKFSLIAAFSSLKLFPSFSQGILLLLLLTSLNLT